MSRETITEYETVERKETVYKCDKCKAIIDSDEAFPVIVGTDPQSTWENVYDNAFTIRDENTHENREQFHLCSDCLDRDKYVSLQEYETTVEKRRKYLEAITSNLSLVGSVSTHIIATSQ